MVYLVRICRDRLANSEALVCWGVVATTLVLAITVGFFLRGGLHGLYSDDYSEKAWARDLSTGRWRLNLNPIHPSFRPLHSILTPNLTNTIPQNEFAARLGIVIVHLLNVLLLAMLAHRLTGSLLIAVLSGGYFLMPVFANEALLWFTNAIPSTIALFFLLLGFHLVLTCHSVKKDMVLLSGGVFAWSVMILFVESGLFTLLLLPFFIGMRRYRGEQISQKVWILALVASYVFLGLYLFFVLQASWQIAVRGGPTLDLAFILSHRVPDVVRRLVFLLTKWGASGPLREALTLGQQEWLSVPGGWIILVGLLLGTWLVPIAYPANHETIPSGRHAFTLVLTGLAWMGLALVPILLLKSQMVEIRTLYIPWAGLALSVAGFFGWMVGLLGRRRKVGIQVVLLIAGSFLFVSSLTMAGLVRTYQLRWELDQRQLAAFRAAVPTLPSSGPIWLLPVELDERTVSLYFGREAQLDRYLAGVFELHWSSSDAIRMEYGGREIYTVATTRWDRLHVTGVQRSKRGQVSTVTIQGKAIPVRYLLAFTYEEGHLVVLNPLEVSSPDGSSSTVVDLPLASRVARAGLRMRPVRFKLESPDEASPA